MLSVVRGSVGEEPAGDLPITEIDAGRALQRTHPVHTPGGGPQAGGRTRAGARIRSLPVT